MTPQTPSGAPRPVVDEPLPSLPGVPVMVCEPVADVARRPALPSLLEEAGCEVTVRGGGRVELDPEGVLLIRGTPPLFPKLIRQLVATPAGRRPLVAIWHMEPLPAPSRAGLRRPLPHPRELARILNPNMRITYPLSNYRSLRRLGRLGLPELLLVSTQGPQEFLAEHGISSRWLPLGYEPSLGADLGLERDVPALFLGTVAPYRRRLLVRRLRARGVPLTVAGESSDEGVWGEKRTRLLNRTRILVDLPRRRGWLAGLRMILGMANGALVVSEPLYAPAPFVPGTHFVSTPLEQMPATIRYYLEHEDERARIAAEGHRLVTEEVTMRRSVARLIELLAEALGQRSGDRCVPEGALE